MAYKYINKTSCSSGGAEVSASSDGSASDSRSWSNRDGVYLQYVVRGSAYGSFASSASADIAISGSDASAFSVSSNLSYILVKWQGSSSYSAYNGRTCYAAPGASASLSARAHGTDDAADIGIYDVAIDQRHPNVYIAGGVWNGYGYQIV